MNTPKLPPLPEPKALGMDFDNGWDGVRAYGYTAEQMQAYAIAAIEAQGVPDGWQLVPKEPTDEMLKEAVMERHGSATYRAVDRKGCEALEEEAKSDWAVMLASAPPAPQASVVQQEPVAWKHDCAALLTNDVELWIDACPHCGKPRTNPTQQAKPQPLLSSEIWNNDAIMEVNADAQLPYELIERFVRAVEAVHNIGDKK